MAAQNGLASAFRTLARSRYSARRFQPGRPIPDDTLQDIITTTTRTPSGFNLQPTQVLLVRSNETKDHLSEFAMLGPGNCYRTRDCSVMAVFLCDLELHKRIPRIVELEREGGMRDTGYLATLSVAASFLNGEGHAATFIKQVATNVMSPLQPTPTIESLEAWGYKNTSLVAQTFVFAAESHGLATCMMEGYDCRRARDVLRVPDRYAMPLMVAAGYEYEEEGVDHKQTPRLGQEEVFFGDTFGERLNLESSAREGKDHSDDKS